MMVVDKEAFLWGGCAGHTPMRAGHNVKAPHKNASFNFRELDGF